MTGLLRCWVAAGPATQEPRNSATSPYACGCCSAMRCPTKSASAATELKCSRADDSFLTLMPNSLSSITTISSASMESSPRPPLNNGEEQFQFQAIAPAGKHVSGKDAHDGAHEAKFFTRLHEDFQKLAPIEI